MTKPAWMTDDLIELSKRAKELGFPQEPLRGNWIQYHDDVGNEQYAVVQVCMPDERLWLDDGWEIEWEDEWHLILTFDICVEWLREMGVWSCNVATGSIRFDFTEVIKSDDPIQEHGMGRRIGTNGNTHHEAIAKCVNKILEGEGE